MKYTHAFEIAQTTWAYLGHEDNSEACRNVALAIVKAAPKGNGAIYQAAKMAIRAEEAAVCCGAGI